MQKIETLIQRMRCKDTASLPFYVLFLSSLSVNCPLELIFHGKFFVFLN